MLHFLTYAILDQGLFLQSGVLGYVAEDVAKRPYITVGFTAFVLLIPLAVTSTKGWIRRLGRRWPPRRWSSCAVGAPHPPMCFV